MANKTRENVLVPAKTGEIQNESEENMKPGVLQNYKACITPILVIVSFYVILFMIGGWKLIIGVLIVSIVLLVWFAVSSR